jgi:hypothetical protein
MADAEATTTSATAVSYPVFKVATAWLAALGISGWSDFAAFAAAFYSVLLIVEWWWKKFWRPLLERKGWFGFKPPVCEVKDGHQDQSH